MNRSSEQARQAVEQRITRSTACWRWNGYHRAQDNRPYYRNRPAYRIVWTHETGTELPANVVLHHTCNNEWCVAPHHLELLMRGDHAREHGIGGDWGQAAKTHCPAGHEYDAENTYTHHRGDGRVERHCIECRREASRRYQAKRASRSRSGLRSSSPSGG